MSSEDLLIFTKSGIYCKIADVYIDPWRPVQRAIITHGHSDHARPGSKSYICHSDSVPILKYRLGKSINIRGESFGNTFSVNGVNFSLYPAGHIIGSAQIRVEYRGEVWVVSGDYKVQHDNVCQPFEPITCNTFITESTFGLPVYQWKPLYETCKNISDWWAENAKQKRPTILTAYSLGKAQNILQNIDKSIGPIYCHGAIQKTNQVLMEAGLFDVKTLEVSENTATDYTNALILTPPSGLNSSWSNKFKHAVTGSASGWMMLRGMRRRRNVDKGFVLSDHADWNGLNTAIKATGASRVIVTHGYQDTYTRYLSEQGYQAQSEKTLFEGEQFAIQNQES